VIADVRVATGDYGGIAAMNGIGPQASSSERQMNVSEVTKSKPIEHVLIINGGAPHAFANGALNAMLSDVAGAVMLDAGVSFESVKAFEPFEPDIEVQRYLRADLIVYQMPAWWMGTPWPMKRYIDEVFTAGYGHLYAHDGRTPDDLTKRYGSGGLLAGRRYLISATWNAPESSFSDPMGLFAGQGVEALYFPFHKANQMLGLEPFPTFVVADVIKNPQITRDVERYRAYLSTLLVGKGGGVPSSLSCFPHSSH
jgi:modulator of drug activity B